MANHRTKLVARPTLGLWGILLMLTVAAPSAQGQVFELAPRPGKKAVKEEKPAPAQGSGSIYLPDPDPVSEPPKEPAPAETKEAPPAAAIPPRKESPPAPRKTQETPVADPQDSDPVLSESLKALRAEEASDALNPLAQDSVEPPPAQDIPDEPMAQETPDGSMTQPPPDTGQETTRSALSSKSKIAPAILIPVAQATLSARLEAQVVEVTVRDHDQITRDQPLSRLNCTAQEIELRKALAREQAAKKQFETRTQQAQQGAIGQLALAESVAALEDARGTVAFFQQDIAGCSILAPFSGRVVKVHVVPHQWVKPGDPLIRIIDDTALEVELTLPSEWLRWIKVGSDFDLEVHETKKQYRATIHTLGALVDPGRRTVKARARLEGRPAELLAGMSGTGRFHSREE